jgi:membrane-associated phospholipid phosphatase
VIGSFDSFQEPVDGAANTRVVTLFAAGVATYVAFPAAPPWMAANMGLLHGVTRTTSDGMQLIGGRTVEVFSEGQASVNETASVPSLHSAVTMLVVLFLWPRVHRPLRPLLLLYPLAMGVTLLATGEHYFFDVLLGWIYAGSVMGAWTWWEHRRAHDGAQPVATSATRWSPPHSASSPYEAELSSAPSAADIGPPITREAASDPL